MVELKRRLIRELGCSLVINIGGGQAAMGTDEAVLKLGPGLVRPGPGVKGAETG